MDFSEFETVDRPVFLQFDHPGTLKPLFQQRKDEDGNPMTQKNETTGEEEPVLDPVGVNLFGRDSEQFQKRRRAVLDERLNEAKTGKKSEVKAIDAEAEGMKTLVACIHSFVNVEFLGVPLTERGHFSRFLEKHPWAKDQIDLGIADRSRFLKASNKA